jgi:oxygen-independent coproporphyrinogen-3 oxidase
MNKKETVSLYVHIPFCRSKCRYCAFYSEPAKDHDIDTLLDALITEMDLYQPTEEICTVYIGGGSPSCLGAANLSKLVNEITKRCGPTEEFTVEVNPSHVDYALLESLRQSGVNRLSIGVQSFNNDELLLLGRTHSADDITSAVEQAKTAGFENISIDLIFAIPGSTVVSWKQSLKSAIDLDVQHISAYALTWEKGTPLQAALESGEIQAVDEETDRTMYESAIEELTEAGFGRYEISNFAHEGFECVHNLRYWANDPFIGIGPGAASWYRGKRSMNIADIKEYVRRIGGRQSVVAETEEPDNIERACQSAVLNLRRASGIDLAEFATRTGYDATEMFAREIEQNMRLGLLEKAQGRIRLTAEALPIADTVLSDFAAV